MDFDLLTFDIDFCDARTEKTLRGKHLAYELTLVSRSAEEKEDYNDVLCAKKKKNEL